MKSLADLMQEEREGKPLDVAGLLRFIYGMSIRIEENNHRISMLRREFDAE